LDTFQKTIMEKCKDECENVKDSVMRCFNPHKIHIIKEKDIMTKHDIERTIKRFESAVRWRQKKIEYLKDVMENGDRLMRSDYDVYVPSCSCKSLTCECRFDE